MSDDETAAHMNTDNIKLGFCDSIVQLKFKTESVTAIYSELNIK